jgi:hypothetical protein
MAVQSSLDEMSDTLRTLNLVIVDNPLFSTITMAPALGTLCGL